MTRTRPAYARPAPRRVSSPTRGGEPHAWLRARAVSVVRRLEAEAAASPVVSPQGTGPSHAKTNLLMLVPVPFTHDVRVTAGKVVFVVKAAIGVPRLLVSEHLTMAMSCRGPGCARAFAPRSAIRTASNGSKIFRIVSPPRVSKARAGTRLA